MAASRADPNFFGAGIKIKAHFLFDLRFGIAGGKHFDADFWGLRKTDPVPKSSHAGRGGPSHISALYSIGRGNWALAEDAPVGNQCPQQVSDLGLVTSMTRSGRRTHYDMTMPIRFDPTREFGKAWIGQDFGPPNEVKLSLRLEVWKFDGDGHGRKVRKKIENARIEACAIFALRIAMEI